MTKYEVSKVVLTLVCRPKCPWLPLDYMHRHWIGPFDDSYSQPPMSVAANGTDPADRQDGGKWLPAGLNHNKSRIPEADSRGLETEKGSLEAEENVRSTQDTLETGFQSVSRSLMARTRGAGGLIHI